MNYASCFIFLSDHALTWPLREMWVLLIKTVSTSEKQEMCLPSLSSIFTFLHTLILHTDPPIFPLPDLSLIFIILCNSTDSLSGKSISLILTNPSQPSPLVRYHPYHTHTYIHSLKFQRKCGPFVKTDGLGVTTCKTVTWVPS